ncbi:Citrate lyase subunit beta [bioreactor metagenome]|jgi:citrate lyase subunit beta/citryl-CoA lyase|uniref:Citrate lyase subunit beta n=2 Tax=root TaxID=1 RepID=A0A562JB26_9FIRM|nr:citrate (pro-3S)-lyase subunit beta [Sedimentibacter saalensis]MEA5094233.1 citrate (pro-3S)-lyase subunit beta [Sedimentibacter saalensis]TWH80339.1 citrate lyase subunit beta/citryl-CoA lyase [Sedimentibacter saalensis]
MVKLRRTMMYVTGNNPANIMEAHLYGSDSIMFDLEDSVSLKEKDSARFLVYNALKTMDYGNVETVVRINGLDTQFGRDDLEAMVRAQPDIIRLPKTETKQDIIDVDNMISEIEKQVGLEVGSTKIMAAVESPLGVMNAYEIATASKRLVAIAIGAEDFVTNMKTTRSPEGIELLAARSNLLMAARAAGIYALDTVYTNIKDDEGFMDEVKLIKQLGFDGKSVIHPRQIGMVHKIYTPTEKEIRNAVRIVGAIKEAESKGSGVIALDGKMIDGPVVDRAYRVLELAKASGVYKEEEQND